MPKIGYTDEAGNVLVSLDAKGLVYRTVDGDTVHESELESAAPVEATLAIVEPDPDPEDEKPVAKRRKSKASKAGE